MFQPRYQNVYLKDPLPSAAVLMPTIKQCLMDTVQLVIEQNRCSSSVIGQDELPTEFRSKPRQRKRRKLQLPYISNVFDHVMLFADEVMMLNLCPLLSPKQASMRWCPCVIRGLGPASSEDHPCLVIQLIDESRCYPQLEVLHSPSGFMPC